MRKSLSHTVANFTVGNIANCLNVWKSITSDREILSSVAGLKMPFCDTPAQNRAYIMMFSAVEKDVISLEIQKLEKKQVIEPTRHERGEIISPIFVRPKKDGSHRLKRVCNKNTF